MDDNSKVSPDGSIGVYFRNIERRLLLHIAEHPLVVGCVAWMTNESILKALSQCSCGVSIIVQKEDFLRPDVGNQNGWKTRLRRMYESLRPLSRYSFEGVSSLSYASDDTLQPVRCVGNHNSERNPAFPRMHNKFLVFCDSEYQPKMVWTGSFNLTQNATMSLENVVTMTNPEIVRAYFREWQQMVALSEPLDWESEWSVPEWRIGS